MPALARGELVARALLVGVSWAAIGLLIAGALSQRTQGVLGDQELGAATCRSMRLGTR